MLLLLVLVVWIGVRKFVWVVLVVCCFVLFMFVRLLFVNWWVFICYIDSPFVNCY